MRRRERIPNLALKFWGTTALLGATAYGFIASSDTGYNTIDIKTLYTIDPDPRQLAVQRVSSQPRGAFEVVNEITRNGTPLTLIAYKGSETFYAGHEKDQLGRPARKVCSDIFLYHATLDQAQKPGQIGITYTAAPAAARSDTDTQHWQVPNAQNLLFVPETIARNNAVLTPFVVTHTSTCRLEPFSG
ncbi:MAG: hypothetical protein V4621_01080 [Pseudomonadota bacterium]